ncbi:MAG: L-aspartate oxidase [Bdellovibrio sp.]|nr:L-aspartate oxidase [Bdellovibrio sp.]
MVTQYFNEINPIKKPNVLILGTGIAGLFTALKFGPYANITLVCKTDPMETNTRYAQGGIATVWSKQDSFEEHIQDTLNAGAGLCKKDIVEICVHEGPDRIKELIELGVQFTHQENNISKATDSTTTYDLHREGGHGKRRILHADDLTGLAIEKALLEQARKSPSIQILEHHVAIDLITEKKLTKPKKDHDKGQEKHNDSCLGAYVLNIKTGQVLTLSADITVLATGGAGKVYLYTSNPDIATGDGIAMAYRAGAKVGNLEFIQFHPTCLYHPSARTYLISEAMRGEGAFLRNLAGQEFMSRYHPMASLAPRDIVARTIDLEMKRTGDKYVLLDCSKIASEKLSIKFPNIYETCLQHGIDLAREPIPVVPAAHYICGGVCVDKDAQTNIEGLYAVGEVAHTGLHGANRLASNSLLEAVVFADRLVKHSLSCFKTTLQPIKLPKTLPKWETGKAVQLEEQIDIAASWLEARTLMWNYVGIVRSNRRLERAKKRLQLIKADVNYFYWNYLLTNDLIELRNLVFVAELIVECALKRHESRGLHYTVDYPERDDKNYSNDTVVG